MQMLPINGPANVNLATPLAGSEKARSTILVVDDRPINRDFLSTLLKYFGYSIIEAASAEQASEIAATGFVDLIISDVYMPGMDGFALLEKLRSEPATSNVPVIFYTAAYKTADDSVVSRARGAFAVLTKPSTPEEIVSTVRSALRANTPLIPLSVNVSSGQADPQYAALVEIMLDLAGERLPTRLMQTCCDSAKALLNASQSLLYVLPSGKERQAQTFYSASSNGHKPEPVDELRLGAALGRLIAGRRPVRFCQIDGKEFGLGSANGKTVTLLCLPIFTNTHDYGCLCLLDKIKALDFSDEDERLGVTLTSQLAMVYENAVFYQQIQDSAARLAYEMEERKRAEEDLDRSRKEQIRLKDQFLSQVSHELRSPVMAAQQFVEILLEGIAGEINGEQREYLNIALRNVNELNSMIGDLLEATRIENGKLRVDLRSILLPEVVKEAVESARPFAQERQIALSLEAPVLPPVLADRSRVREIVTNLLDNALKFTPPQGAVGVHVAMDDQDPRFVRVKVTDTGCGINADDLGKVFDRHYQGSGNDCMARKGLGLGLHICKELVTLQRGQILVTSDGNAGSTFSFTLPLSSRVGVDDAQAENSVG